MNTFAEAVLDKATTIRTENGDKTYSTSLDANVDLFFKIAAIRGRGAATAVDLFMKAYKEDAELASRILLWARDVRGGAGERQVFRDLIQHLEKTDADRLERLMGLIPEVGRWDDFFVLETKYFRDQAFSMFAAALEAGDGLAAKWAPRENSKNKQFANGLREFMNLSWVQYRKLISRLSKTVEQQMCANDWDNINFSHVPSVANARYSKTFWKHQADRYGLFVQKATRGEEKINANALFPYDCVKRTVDEFTANALWNNLPDYVPEGVSFIPMIDTSGSMSSAVGNSGVTCMDVSISIGMYLAERNKSAFNNLALTFSSNPKFVKVPKTDSVRSKYNTIRGMEWGMSTNLDAAMHLVLNTAVSNKVPAEDMPQFLIVISDMEFNAGYYGDKSTSVAERTRDAFERHGYKMPNIVWWNVQSRGSTTPVRFDEKGMVLVSGCSPTVTKSVLCGDVDPRKAMIKTVSIERYDH